MNGFSYSILVVTYNRLGKLKKCMECINAQELQPDRVIIINNNSNDGTGEYLDGIGRNNDRLHIVHMKKNLGGAGGFARGVEEFAKGESKWLIMIDDDAMLRPDYARHIAQRANQDGDSGLVAYAGTVYENGKTAVNHRRILTRGFINRELPIAEEQYREAAFDCDQATFCGLVINQQIIEKIGLPREDFFIWYDDTEYSMRIRNVGRITVIPQSAIDHECVNPEGGSNLTVFTRFKEKEYYGVRNRLIVARHYYSKATIWSIVLFTQARIIKQRLWAVKALVSGSADSEAARYNLMLLKRAYKDGMKDTTGRVSLEK